MQVLTFSRQFPAYHPKAGQPTYFVEKLWQSIYMEQFEQCTRAQFYFSTLYGAGIDIYAHDKYQPKHHTIRAGHRFKPGDWFSPHVWSGQPYRSKQIIIAPPIQVKKVWDFKLTTEDDDGENDWSYIDFLGKQYTCYGYGGYDDKLMVEIAKNDGLEINDFYDWFIGKGRTSKQIINYQSKIFKGQIICWNENIQY